MAMSLQAGNEYGSGSCGLGRPRRLGHGRPIFVAYSRTTGTNDACSSTSKTVVTDELILF